MKTNDGQKPAQEWRFAKLARAGATIGAIAIIGAPTVELFRHSPFLQDNLLYAVGLLGGIGLIMVAKPLKVDRTDVEIVLRFYRYARFWGFIFVGVAGLVYYFTPERDDMLKQLSATSQEIVRPARKALPPEEKLEIPAPTPPEFPELKVSGIVINGTNSSAVINSKVVVLGEMINGVRLVAVTNSEIVVEYERFRQIVPVTLR